MAESGDDTIMDGGEAGDPELADDGAGEALPRRRWRRASLAVTGLLALALGYVWTTREDIANDVIAGRLDQYGIGASYRIESFSARRQVIRDVVIGDPANPDMTVEKAEVSIVPRFGYPEIGWIKLTKPRLYGKWKNGRLSFGTLDKLIYEQPSTEPFSLPDLRIVLDDGRALFRLPQGQVGLKVDGRGKLNDGFSGIVAAISPELALGGCRSGKTTLYGSLKIVGGEPRFKGPLRTEAGQCEAGNLKLASSAMELDAVLDKEFSGGTAKAGIIAGMLGFSGGSVTRTAGSAKATYRDGRLTGQYDLSAKGVATQPMRMSNLDLSGTLRARDGLSSFEWQSDVNGKGVQTGGGLERGMADLQKSAEDTLIAPLLEQARAALARESGNGTLDARFTMRRKADGQVSLVVPMASLKGRSGASLVSISRLQAALGSNGLSDISGNFSTGGRGLPQITGRMEQGVPGTAAFRLTMPAYTAGRSSIALPELLLVQRPGGVTGFAGRVIVSGDVPGGSVRLLELPLSGYFSANGGLSFGERCLDVRFQQAEFAGLALSKNRVAFCPAGNGPILRSDARGTRLAARMPAFDLPGTMSGSPVRLRSAGATIAMPGQTDIRGVEFLMGRAGEVTRMAVANLDMNLAKGLAGRFRGAEFSLAAVPLDIADAAGNWRYANGRLALDGAAFTMTDRQRDARFQPMVARDAQWAMEDSMITGEALLREPESDRPVGLVALRHNLATGNGRADLRVDGLLFDEKLQPEMLSRRMLGVVANVAGTVTGQGEIVWQDGVVTSQGDFGSESLDLAAAFGPAQGVSGTIHFNDLIGLTTAPGQKLKVRAINPGIEVLGGELSIDLMEGEVLSLRGAQWPFLGGTLRMEPSSMRVGVAETRRYELRLEGVDAALFVQQMELGNIAATGIFDGVIPLVFDENGGRIEQGKLVSRPPGGNLSYVGELTYKDLSTMANFAFDALRSLDYREMQVILDGPLTGEIVTKVTFDGVTQGAGTKRNFLTKQVAKLPIKFNVNIRAPFYKLINSLKAMYDPALIRDPRDIGLMDAEGNIVENPTIDPLKLLDARHPTSGEVGVQPPESENVR